jgi:hypothetical protein
MQITFEQPGTPDHAVDLSTDGIRLDGVLIDLDGGPDQLVAVLGEPTVTHGIGSNYNAWDHAGIGAATYGTALSNIDVVDSITTTGAVLPAAAGQTRVTVDGRDVLELDWDAAAAIDRWTTSINVGAFRVERCEAAGEYSYWTFTVAL